MIKNNLSEKDIIKKYNHNWLPISCHHYLTEDFIRKYHDKIDWYNVFIHQKLSESLIIEFKNNIYWNMISYYQKLSFKFIKENIDKLNINYLFKNKNISQEIKQELKIYFEIL